MKIVHMNLTASALIIAVVVIRAVLLHRLPKRTFLVLWGVALCRLLIPYELPSPFSVFTLAEKLGQAGDVRSLSGLRQLTAATVTGSGGVNAAAAGKQVSISPFLVIWLSGILIFALFFIVTHIRCRRIYKTALPVDSASIPIWRETHRLKRRIQIKRSDRVASPLTYGMLRPTILLPAAMDGAGDGEIGYVLEHEYIHIKRLDLPLKWLLTAALCANWFNPLVWAMYVLANRDIELSCDEAVVRTFGGSVRSDYALTLIGLEENKSRLSPLCNNFSKNAIEERVMSVMKYKKATVMTIIAAVLIVAGVTTGFATAAKNSEDQSAAASSPIAPAASPVQATDLLVAPATSSAWAAAHPPASETFPVPSSAPVPERPPVKPVSQEALPKYWAMGALNVDGVPYLPLVATAEKLGYTVTVSSHKVEDPTYDPQVPNAVEYRYELAQGGQVLGCVCIDIAGDKIGTYMADQLFCHTHDIYFQNGFAARDNTLYMSAQYVKEALDTENTLP